MTQLHDYGEEFTIKTTFRQDEVDRPVDIEIGLYYDSNDSLSEGNNTGDITTEPGGSNYNRQAATLDSGDFTSEESGGDWQITISDQTFNVEQSTQEVDAYFVTVEFNSEEGGGLDDHIFWTGDLDQTYDLHSVDELTLSGAGLKVS